MYESYNCVYNFIYYLHNWLGDGSFVGKNVRIAVELSYETKRKRDPCLMFLTFLQEKLFFKNSPASTWKLPTNPSLICKFVTKHTGTGIYCKYIEYTWIKKDPCTHNIFTISSSAQAKSQHNYAVYRHWTASWIRAKLIFSRIFLFLTFSYYGAPPPTFLGSM